MKYLDYNYLFDRKHMIEYLEAELAGAPKEPSNNDNSSVVEEANVDEAITAEANASNDMENDLKDEQNTKY